MFAPRERAPTLAILLFIALGVALRFIGLGVQSLWYDEACTLCIAGAQNTFELLRMDRHPPLHFLAFKAWMNAFGESDEIVRILPAILSSISLVLFARLAQRLAGARGATIAIALYAASPFAVWIGQEARMYAFVELGALIALLGVTSFIAGRRASGYASMVVGTAIALGSHYYGGFVGASIVAIALAALAFGRVGAAGALAIATAPIVALGAWMPWLVSAIPEQMKTDWGFQARMTSRDLVELPVRFVLVQLTALPDGWRWLTYLIGAPLVIGLALAIVRAFGKLRFEGLAILLAFAAPVAMALLVALVVPPSFGPRYLVTAAPAAVLLIAIGLDSITIAPVRAMLLALAFTGALGLSCLHKSGNVREDYRGACEELVAQWRAGDAVLAISGTPEIFSQAPLRHYLRDRSDIIESIRDATLAVSSIRESFAPHQRVHVIYREAPYAVGALDALKRALTVQREDPKRFRIQHVLLEMP
jgi:uncharacterized membrane protein